MTNQVKTYKRRDSATAALRKLGMKSISYNDFIKPLPNGSFSCDIEAAKKSLAKPKRKAPKKSKSDQSPRETISSVAHELILSGKTNKQVWDVIKKKFELGENKRTYPSWYRCELRRKGELPDHCDFMSWEEAPTIIDVD